MDNLEKVFKQKDLLNEQLQTVLNNISVETYNKLGS